MLGWKYHLCSLPPCHLGLSHRSMPRDLLEEGHHVEELVRVGAVPARVSPAEDGKSVACEVRSKKKLVHMSGQEDGRGGFEVDPRTLRESQVRSIASRLLYRIPASFLHSIRLSVFFPFCSCTLPLRYQLLSCEVLREPGPAAAALRLSPLLQLHLPHLPCLALFPQLAIEIESHTKLFDSDRP